ncbi:ribosome silencing factor [Synechocystis salina]|uniref:Ribosomal silencing factor RsfS n=2 Tax=Synechocystis TaxID=1142 RepID=A0ABR9VVM9_9SYNC|nr:ribosome silencing factor [Synechocystis salina]MBE9242292.1 ribosome silencing factor [Synechocystis salina LEGE 00041]MBE9255409.1 ribosome silencing factor [Synechocystis salina LEGE 00031]
MTEISRFDASPPTLTVNPTVPVDAPATEHLVWTIAQAAEERKAGDLVILKVTDVSYLADYFVISTGFSRTQVRAIADNIEKQVELVHGQLPTHTEGNSESIWVLQDFGDVLVHTFMPEEREFYKLEAFWGHAQEQTLADIATAIGIAYNPPTSA